jgi:hypothetical protein
MSYTQKIPYMPLNGTQGLIINFDGTQVILPFTCAHNIKLYQMDVNSAFLNGKISKLVYVEQPPSFEDPKRPNHVHKLSKALYGLKQTPRAPNTSKLGRLTLPYSLRNW